MTRKPTYEDLEQIIKGLEEELIKGEQAEEAILLTQFAMDRAPDSIILVDDQGNLAYVNNAACVSMGYTREELLSMKVFDIDPDFPREGWEQHKIDLKRLGRMTFEGRHRAKDGRLFPVEVTTNYCEYKGRFFGIAFDRDIAERQRADEALKKSEGMLRLITENMSDMIRVTDLQGNNLYVSPSHLHGLGYRMEDRVGKSSFDIVHPDDVEMIINKIAESLPGNKPARVEYRVRHARGHYLWLETVVDLLRDDQGAATTAVMSSRDISDQKRAEQALQKSEERYRSLVENADEAILVIQDGMIKYSNSRAVTMFGYSEQEFPSIPVLELVHPEDRDEETKRYLQKINGNTAATRHTYRAIFKNGQIAWIEISSALIDWEGRPATLNLITDITARRHAEEEKRNLEERLQRAEKMEALGQLAGGVAHDLNNVLGVLSGYSELLLMEIPEGQRARSHVEKILKSTEKGAAIIQDLLTLARRGVTVSDVINLNHVVSGFLKTPVFEKMKDYHPRVTFRTECEEELLNIKGSPVHLEKTLMNLVSNAAESISEKGVVTIRTQSIYLDKPIRGYDEIEEGDYTVLAVSDTGMGILAEHREKIFEPFYTKKTMGRSGTGLGLAIVWGTVKDHNGYIDVQTKVGEGTTFTLYFPTIREELTALQQSEPIEQYRGNGESVLVVDDIAEQRDVASGLLKKLGYEVHAVSSGVEAVEYLKSNKADILVLDMIMAPDIDGLETYKRVLEINPQQKAILVSGFSETERVRDAQKLGAGAYVRKPYGMEKIGVVIRNELKRQHAV